MLIIVRPKGYIINTLIYFVTHNIIRLGQKYEVVLTIFLATLE